MERDPDNHLKDMVFRGAFFVILVYVLVFLYNSGLLDKLRKSPSPKPSPTPSAVIETQPVTEPPQTDYQQESTESLEDQETP